MEGHEKENELFLIGNELTYKILIKVIEDHIKNFNEYTKKDFDLLEAKCQLLESENNILKQKCSPNNQIFQPNNNFTDNTFETLSTEFNRTTTPLRDSVVLQNLQLQIEQYQKQIQIQYEKQEKQLNELLNKNIPTNTFTGFQQPNQTIGPRLQKINPENLTLIKTYESVSEALQESNHLLKRPSIQKAIKENTVYQGFRWAYKDRNEDPTIVIVPPTRPVQIQNVGYIAKLNENKTEILNVYIDRKTACFQNGFQSSSALDISVKKDKSIRGFYYILFNKCSEELQENFIQNRGVPILYKDGVGQFDLNHNLIQEFSCKYDCIKKLRMSEKTLAKTLDKEIAYNGYYYRRLPEKLCC